MKVQFLSFGLLATLIGCGYTATPDAPTVKIISKYEAAMDTHGQANEADHKPAQAADSVTKEGDKLPPTVNWTFVQVTYEVEQAVVSPPACCSGYKARYLYTYPKEFAIIGNDKPTLEKAAKLVPLPLRGKDYKAVSFEVLRVEKRPVPPTTPIEREKE